jgi:outer membrane protein assembly factor BamE (lipoprotein component of BamABCDE complex)
VPAGTLGLALAAVVLGAGCSTMKQQNGYVIDDYTLDQIRPGVTDRDSVATLLGTPTTSATFGDGTWYYISRKAEQFAFLDEEVTEQRVVAVRFSDAGIVDEVKRYSIEDGKIVEPVDRITPTRGREMTVLEQLFGNLGRFNNQEQVNPASRRGGI